MKRYDKAEISGIQTLGSGSIRVNAALTRTGVFTYRNQDGTERREYRPDSEVFKPTALATFAGLPVTIGHPGLITPGNWKEHSIGHVGDDVRQDGTLVGASLIVSDQTAIEKVQRGDLKEISCGYDVDLVETPGEINGERYDAIQTNIRGNHVALGPKGWGRAGESACIRLDGDEDVVNFSVPTETITAKDVVVNVSGAAEIEKLQARCDALAEENTALKKEIASVPEKIKTAVASRVALESAALKEIPSFKADGKTDREIKEAVIKVKRPSFKADGRSDEYVQAAFEMALETETPTSPSLAEVRKDAGNVQAPLSPMDELAAKEAKSREEAKNAWKLPLSVSAK